MVHPFVRMTVEEGSITVTTVTEAQSFEKAGHVQTVKETATELKCSISFIYKLMKVGELAFERRGRRKLPLAESVADYRRRSVVQQRPAGRPPHSSPQPRRYSHLFSQPR